MNFSRNGIESRVDTFKIKHFNLDFEERFIFKNEQELMSFWGDSKNKFEYAKWIPELEGIYLIEIKALSSDETIQYYGIVEILDSLYKEKMEVIRDVKRYQYVHFTFQIGRGPIDKDESLQLNHKLEYYKDNISFKRL